MMSMRAKKKEQIFKYYYTFEFLVVSALKIHCDITLTATYFDSAIKF